MEEEDCPRSEAEGYQPPPDVTLSPSLQRRPADADGGVRTTRRIFKQLHFNSLYSNQNDPDGQQAQEGLFGEGGPCDDQWSEVRLDAPTTAGPSSDTMPSPLSHSPSSPGRVLDGGCTVTAAPERGWQGRCTSLRRCFQAISECRGARQARLAEATNVAS